MNRPNAQVYARALLLLGVAVAIPTAIFLMNFGRPHLQMMVIAPGQGRAVLELAPDDKAVVAQVDLKMVPGFNWLDFTLPHSGERPVRLALDAAPGRYQVAQIEWHWLGFRRVLSVGDALVLTGNRIKNVTLVDRPWPRLFFETVERSSILVLPPLKLGATFWLTVILVPVAVLLLLGHRAWGATAGRQVDRFSLEMAATSVFCSYGVLFLAFLRHHRRWPFWDDWGYLLPGPYNLTESVLGRAFLAGNDTVSLTGQLIDSLALHATRFDFASSRMLALSLLGATLLTTMAALRAAFQEAPDQVFFPIMLLTASVAADAYWGQQMCAYHQHLPLLFASLLILLLPQGEREAPRTYVWRSVVIGLLSVLCGLAYISGTLLLLALGLAYALLYHRDLRTRAGWRRHIPGLAPLFWGALTLTVQLFLIWKLQGSLFQQTHATAPVYAGEARFWLFFIGLFGKACGYSGRRWTIDLAITLVLLSPTLLLVVSCLFRRPPRGSSQERLTFLALFGGLAAIGYAAAIAYGRAGFVPAGSSTARIISLAKGRFHYYWISALLPWLWCGWYLLLGTWRKHPMIAAMFLASVWLVMLGPRTDRRWRHGNFFKKQAALELRGLECVQSRLADRKTKEQVVCADLFPDDLGPALANLMHRGITLGDHYPGVLTGGSSSREKAR